MYAEYNFRIPNTSEDFKFVSYNLEYLMLDLFEVIYIDNDLPWEDIKYKKRLHRLLFFSIIELLSLKKGETQLMDFIDILKNIANDNISLITSDSNYFVSKISTITNTKILNLMFVKLFKQHKQIVDLSVSISTPETDREIEEYYLIFQNLLKETDTILSDINSFCAQDFLGKININDESFRNINQIGGLDIEKKYLKYKNKYLKTKINSK
jgi:hypothetical protein